MRGHSIAALHLPLLATANPVGCAVLSALAPQASTIRAQAPGSMPTSVRSTPTPTAVKVLNGFELRHRPGISHGPGNAHGPGIALVAATPSVIVTPSVSQSVATSVDPLVAAPQSGVVASAVSKPIAAPVAAADVPSAAPPAAMTAVGDPLAAPAPSPVALAAIMSSASQAVSPAPPAAVSVSAISTATTSSPPLVTGDDFVTVQWIETHIGTSRTWVPKTYTFHFEAMSQAPLPGVGSIGMGTLTGETGQTKTIIAKGAAPTPVADLRKGIAAAVAVGIAGLVV